MPESDIFKRVSKAAAIPEAQVRSVAAIVITSVTAAACRRLPWR